METERIPAWSDLAEPKPEETAKPVEPKKAESPPTPTTNGVGFGNTKRPLRRRSGWSSNS